PFISNKTQKRQYTKYQMCEVFLRDGFIDRYSGKKLLFPGIFKILTIEFPDIFKYHRNWKMSETHMIYWELFPTIDHVVPISRGGNDIQENMVTTSMIRNSAKSNWTLEELGWKLSKQGITEDWDGLLSYFLKLTEVNSIYLENKYISEWKTAILKVIKNKL
ncbi:MAG: HNH endonuclease, partial [Bacteroidales bacterium]|nr:HNH endonuclease [Bacteroidales bacterium]